MDSTTGRSNWRDAGVVDTSGSPNCRLRPVPVRAVTLEDGFWGPRLEANRDVSIPLLLRLLEDHGVVDNFRRLTGASAVERRGPLFTDSDLYKWMEAAAHALQYGDAPKLGQALSDMADTVIAAQGEDGYLNTWFQDERADRRFTDLGSAHELYCAGHLFQAAIAHHRATGETKLLDCAMRFADHICDTFGPGRLQESDGHPEVEMALVELFRETGRARYLDLAGFFLHQRGLEVREEISGHAVRAAYFCAGGADYFAETGDEAALASLEHQWDDMVEGKMYVTGGIGSRHETEGFGRPFELPNDRAYTETCGAIGSIFWNWRMLALRGEARFADLLERALYNGFLSGVSLDGRAYFYMNPLAYDGHGETDPWNARGNRKAYQRAEWHGCTCCPPNVQRMVASLPGYVYGTSDDGVWIHLYDKSSLQWRIADGTAVTVRQRTEYPWDGSVRVEVSPERPAEFSLYLRIPGWCEGATVARNGEDVPEEVVSGSYLRIRRRWQAGDEVQLNLPMPVRLVECHPRVPGNRGSVALQRGPVVYCLESVDNLGVDVLDARIRISRAKGIVIEQVPLLLGGVARLHVPGEALARGENLGPLYRPLGSWPAPRLRDVSLVAIPYYAWANRGPSAMTVWARAAE